MTVYLARDDSKEIPVDAEGRVPPLRWFSTTEGPLISTSDGQLGNLARHGIRANGDVTPSILVSGGTERAWHEWATLDGWDRGERPEKH